MTGWLSRVKTLADSFRACPAINVADREIDCEGEEIGQLREAFFKASKKYLPYIERTTCYTHLISRCPMNGQDCLHCITCLKTCILFPSEGRKDFKKASVIDSIQWFRFWRPSYSLSSLSFFYQSVALECITFNRLKKSQEWMLPAGCAPQAFQQWGWQNSVQDAYSWYQSPRKSHTSWQRSSPPFWDASHP